MVLDGRREHAAHSIRPATEPTIGTVIMTGRGFVTGGVSPLDISIRPVSKDDFGAFFNAAERSFSHQGTEEEVELERPLFEPERSLVAFDGDEMVGTAGIFSLDLTVPGGSLPMAGVTAVGVNPTHRRRGILTELMRRQLEHCRDHGDPLAGLWASESSIYGRFGYGLAAFTTEVEIERTRAAFREPVDASRRLRMLDKERALDMVTSVYDRVRLTRPGMFARSAARWTNLLADPEVRRRGMSPLFFVVSESSEGPDGYVIYRTKQSWDEGFPNGTLSVRELQADAPEAYAALWRYCFDVDLMTKIEAWPRPVDEPLHHLLAEPRRLVTRLWDSLWIRIVDVPMALAGRRYQTKGRLVVDVRDAFCPWNEGRYALDGGPDGATCARSDDEADLSVAADALGAVYLGGVRFGTLRQVGRVEERSEGAVRRADAMFGWDPQPWCPEIF